MDFLDMMPCIVAQHQMNEATRQASDLAQEAFHRRTTTTKDQTGGTSPMVGPFPKPPPTAKPGPGRNRSG